MLLRERRKTLRREADRKTLEQAQKFQRVQEGETSKERRHLLRRAIRHQCQVRIQIVMQFSTGGMDSWDSSKVPVKGRLLDLSASGCSLFTHQRLEMGQKLNVEVGMAKGPSVIAGGVVRWTKAVEGRNGYASGMEFTAIEQKARKRIHNILQEVDATLGL